MDNGRAAGLAAAAMKKRACRKTPADDQIKKLFSKPCIIRWSDGHESHAIIGDVFFTEEAYYRYKAYKEKGQAYPVEVAVDPLQDPATIIFPEDPEGEQKICETISRGFTQSLKRYVEDNWEPVDIAQLLDVEAAAEIDRQATEGQRGLQQLADAADEAIRGTL